MPDIFRKYRLLLPAVVLLAVFFHSIIWADEKPKNVVIIRYRIAPTYFSTVVAGFKEKMAERGFIEGKNINYIDVLTRSADKTSLQDVIDAVNKYKDVADMFITCGWVSLKTREMLKGTGVPQLFAPVLESVALKMLPSITEMPKTNLSGIYLMYPPEKILRLARFIIPEIRNYAYVYDSRIPADMIFKKSYQKLKKDQKHNIAIHYLDLAKGQEYVLQALQELKIEAYGGIVGSFKKRKELAKSNLPVISAFTLDIEKNSLENHLDGNVLAGLFNPFRYCGNQAAELTADIFEKSNTIENTVPRPAKQMVFINLKAAKNLNRPVSFKALESVDIVIQ